jgi:asparagine synthase (glutamine-hydrolysing)
MCGINGIIHFNNPLPAAKDTLNTMNNALRHRGPNAEGIFVDDVIAIGHRRLSIIDTSENANQPLFSASGNTAIVFNGEIYNYIELREELQSSYEFKTSSDTEVILAQYESDGENAFQKLAGMFAFILFDIKHQLVYVVRDRFGIKPLYYGELDGVIYVSSEMRALIETNVFSNKLNTNVLAEYVSTQTVHFPNTIIEDIYVLEPGHYLKIDKNQNSKKCYYEIETEQSFGTKLEFQNQLKSALSKSVEQHLRSDVSYGAFLSGGIDSSLLVGLMAEISQSPIQTFTISFEEDSFNESQFAQLIAKKWNTQHHEIVLNASDFLTKIPEAIHAMDHPSGDGPNTYVVTEAAKKSGLTVAISGLGGDELFAGYPVFNYLSQIKKQSLFALPQAFRSLLASGYSLFNSSEISRRKAEILRHGSSNLARCYNTMRTVWDPKKILQSHTQAPFPEHVLDAFLNKEQLITSVSQSEIYGYMHDVLLRDSDQMSMANAFEIRVPFLDHRVVSCALQTPDEMKFPHSPKQFLTETFTHLLPSEIVNRPKMGFTLPWNIWMRNELKSFCEDGIAVLVETSYFKNEELKNAWQSFKNGNQSKPFTSFWHLVVLGHWIKNNNIQCP